jgi:hypothetical protein
LFEQRALGVKAQPPSIGLRVQDIADAKPHSSVRRQVLGGIGKRGPYLAIWPIK